MAGSRRRWSIRRCGRHEPVAEDRGPLDEQLWRGLERVTGLAIYSETNIQSRFGNFLLADSFLLLSWATVYAADLNTRSSSVVLAVLAVVSALLGAVFALLGLR